MTHSIRLNLLKWLIIPFLVINLIGAGLTYWLAWTPARIAFDQSLADTAWALIPQLEENNGIVSLDLSSREEKTLRLDHFDTVYFVVRSATGDMIAGDKDFPKLELSDKWNDPLAYDGLMRKEAVRIIALKTTVFKAPVFIGVAETLRKRVHIKSVTIIVLTIAEIVLSIVSCLIIESAVKHGLFPLNKMHEDLNARSSDNLDALNESNLPTELLPITQAINSLLNKIKIGAIAKQDFLANVAHQLRTPLSTLKVQLEWLQEGKASQKDISHSLMLMMASTDRMIRKTNQLLSLARAEPSQFEKTRLKALRLDKLVEDCIQHFIGEADKKNIDLGFNLNSVTVNGDHFLLRDLIDNLIDNAIHYSPIQGKITVSCFIESNYGFLNIEDSGVGIPDNEKEKIFDRFYRLDDKTSGSGLGLAIVLAIAKDHNAEISVQSGENNIGTLFSVKFEAIIM
ncbi:MAG: sensor histidine kinase [Pseudomonadota bacterium]